MQLEGTSGEKHPGRARQETAEAKADRIAQEQLRLLGDGVRFGDTTQKWSVQVGDWGAAASAKTTLSLGQIAEHQNRSDELEREIEAVLKRAKA